jgi:carbamate kinase
MLIVAALGGNALLRRGQKMDAATMEANVKRAVKALAPLAQNNRLVITHGNGPQVGLLALQAAAYGGAASYPLDVLGAETEGMIGYLIAREMRNVVRAKEVVTLLTQTVVRSSGPAFDNPSKFVGPVYSRAQADDLQRERGWIFKQDGVAYRRVVASPDPCRIIELPVIQQLLQHDVTVVCAGGGGIPVTIDAQGMLCGVEAVVDKDLASAWLAIELQADRLLLLTDVDGVYLDWGQPNQEKINRITPAQLHEYEFAAGSMAPKISAACRYIAAEGTLAAIGSLDDAEKMLDGLAGTCVVPED